MNDINVIFLNNNTITIQSNESGFSHNYDCPRLAAHQALCLLKVSRTISRSNPQDFIKQVPEGATVATHIDLLQVFNQLMPSSDWERKMLEFAFYRNFSGLSIKFKLEGKNGTNWLTTFESVDKLKPPGQTGTNGKAA